MKVISRFLPKKAIRRNVLWNILGQGLPLLLAVFFIPFLIRGLGTDRFGALTLVWTILTYFTLFDMGVGRALTQALASRENAREEAELVRTASVLLFVLGALAALLLAAAAPWITARIFNLHGPIASELSASLRLLALALPFLINSLALRGVLEAKRRFDLSNWIRLPQGVFTYGAPLLVLPFTRSLPVIVAIMLAGRLAAWAWNLWMVLRLMPELREAAAWRGDRARELLRFGGWMTASGVVTPFTDNLDKILVTSILSISAVAYYTTPFELASKFWILSAAIGGVIFPEFASRFRRDPEGTRALYGRGMRYMLGVIFPIVLVGTAYAGEGLGLWLGDAFARNSGVILQWFFLGLLAGSFRMVPYTFLLGVGRPGLVLLNDLLELPFYALLLYVMIHGDGLRGAAIAYALRMTFGFLFFTFASGRLLRFTGDAYLRVLAPPFAAAGVLLLCQALPMSQVVKAAYVACVLLAFAAYAWRFVLEPADRETIRLKARGALGR